MAAAALLYRIVTTYGRRGWSVSSRRYYSEADMLAMVRRLSANPDVTGIRVFVKHPCAKVDFMEFAVK